MGKLNNYFSGLVKGLIQEQPRFEVALGMQLAQEFSMYMDMLASANPQRFHHVYEWDQCGDAGSRLFNITVVPAGRGVVISYEFLPSVTPNRNGQVFWNKAQVMESGDLVTNNPNGPVYIESIDEFRVGPFTFKPGGPDTTGAFQDTFMRYFMARIPTISKRAIQPSSFTSQGGYNDARRIYDSIIVK